MRASPRPSRLVAVALVAFALLVSSALAGLATGRNDVVPAKAKKTKNLLKNPGAESGSGSSNGSVVHIPSWTTVGATAVKYGATGGFPTSGTPGPTKRGANFFAGGPHAAEDVETLTQTVSLTSYATKIDAGGVKFTLSAWLGGSGADPDTATVYLTFYSASHQYLSGAAIGPVTSSDRHDVTKFLQRTAKSTVPATARTVDVDVEFDGTSGSYDNGYADNLSLVLSGV